MLESICDAIMEWDLFSFTGGVRLSKGREEQEFGNFSNFIYLFSKYLTHTKISADNRTYLKYSLGLEWTDIKNHWNEAQRRMEKKEWKIERKGEIRRSLEKHAENIQHTHISSTRDNSCGYKLMAIVKCEITFFYFPKITLQTTPSRKKRDDKRATRTNKLHLLFPFCRRGQRNGEVKLKQSTTQRWKKYFDTFRGCHFGLIYEVAEYSYVVVLCASSSMFLRCFHNKNLLISTPLGN